MGKEKLFGGEGSEENQAVYDALHKCAEDAYPLGTIDNKESVYTYMENTPRTSFCVELVQKLHEMGFSIVKNS
jgi:hypothetical protein